MLQINILSISYICFIASRKPSQPKRVVMNNKER